MESYPTPAGAAGIEWMNEAFFKMHPGAPVHIFTSAPPQPFHCHPFPFITHIAVGSYDEEILRQRSDATYYVETVRRLAGTTHHMPADVPHRLVGLPEGLCVTRCEYGEACRKSGEYLLQSDGTLLQRYWDEPPGEWHQWPRD